MSSHDAEPSWREYLASLGRYLSAVRATAEDGAAPPEPPARPTSPCPPELREEAHVLRLGVDQLSVEVSEHLSFLEARLSSAPRSPYRAHQQARYLDTPL